MLFLLFSPDHLIHHTCVALDNLHNLSRYVLIYIIRHRLSVIAIKVHLHRCVYSLQQAFFVNACEHKAAFVQRFRALRRGADAHRRERRSCFSPAVYRNQILQQRRSSAGSCNHGSPTAHAELRACPECHAVKAACIDEKKFSFHDLSPQG